jgi:hypothetical protein
VPRLAAGKYAGSHPRPAIPAGRSIQSLDASDTFGWPVTDKPKIQPDPESKAMMVDFGAFVAGFFLTMAVMLALEHLLNKTSFKWTAIIAALAWITVMISVGSRPGQTRRQELWTNALIGGLSGMVIPWTT